MGMVGLVVDVVGMVEEERVADVVVVEDVDIVAGLSTMEGLSVTDLFPDAPLYRVFFSRQIYDKYHICFVLLK